MEKKNEENLHDMACRIFWQQVYFLTGCSQEKSSSSESATEETTAATVATATTEETEPATEAPTEPELKTIGEKAEGEHVLQRDAEKCNRKGNLRRGDQGQFSKRIPENMMKDSDVFCRR